VQADTTRTRLRTCTSNSASVVSWNRAVIGLALPSRRGRMYAQIMVKVGHFRPAVMAMVLRLEGSQADMRHQSSDVCCRGAGSTGRRNTSVKSLCWCFKLQGLTWSFV
jgi:hypothetical protein